MHMQEKQNTCIHLTCYSEPFQFALSLMFGSKNACLGDFSFSTVIENHAEKERKKGRKNE